jgi:hypothetical protein
MEKIINDDPEMLRNSIYKITVFKILESIET